MRSKMFKTFLLVTILTVATARYSKTTEQGRHASSVSTAKYTEDTKIQIEKATPVTPVKQEEPKVRCYQCEYRPPHSRVEEFVYPVQVQEKVSRWTPSDPGCWTNAWTRCPPRLVSEDVVRTVWRSVNQTVTTAGGFPACSGPIDETKAEEQGLQVFDCDSNCYVRRDAAGNIQRGCYAGEYGVNPSILGCNTQAGVTYCFCLGDKCNSGTGEE